MNSAHTAVFLVIGLIVLIICLIGIIIYFHDYKHYNYDYDPKWSYMLQELAEYVNCTDDAGKTQEHLDQQFLVWGNIPYFLFVFGKKDRFGLWGKV